MKLKSLLLSIFILSAAAASDWTPYPIYNMRYGKVTAVDPWLIPQDGFVTLRNCHLSKGVLEKRRGYTEFGQIVYVDTADEEPNLITGPVMGIYNYYSGATEQLIVMDCNRVNKYITSASVNKTITAFANAGGGEVQVTSASHSFDTNDVVTISGTTNYNGIFTVTKVNTNAFKITDTWVADDATGTASQEKFIDLTRNKIRFQHASKQTWQPAPGEEVCGATSDANAIAEEVITDTGTFAGDNANGTIIFRNGTITGTFEDGEELQQYGTPANIVGDADGANTDDEFTGDNTDFFWVENWNEVSYITNDNDVIQKYNGTNLSRLHIDLDVEAGPDNDLTRTKLILVYKGRLILFDVTERGTAYHQRARWCEINDPDTWKNANYIDADTDQWIMAADSIGDDIIVFFERSVWKFSYTADPTQPFRWDKIDTVEGCYATMSLLPFSDEIIALGPTHLVGTDGRDAYTIDEKIPDFTLTWNVDSVAYSFGIVIEEDKQGWISYASTSASSYDDGNIYPDSVLVLNFDDNSYSTYSLSVHTLGYSSLESDLTWNDVGSAWEDIDYSWDEKSIQSGYPVNLMGCRNGKIYQLNDSGADDGSAIEFKAISGQWNPYYLQGKKAWLGWIDFLVDTDESVTFNVKFYKDSKTSSYVTKTVTCDGLGDKTWKRVFCGEIGTFHQIELTNNAITNRPRIHCITPWFKPGGRVF